MKCLTTARQGTSERAKRERVWENIPHETKRKDKKRKKKIEKRLGLKKNEKKIYMKKK